MFSCVSEMLRCYEELANISNDAAFKSMNAFSCRFHRCSRQRASLKLKSALLRRFLWSSRICR
jgi:hypothetical protein